MLCLLALVGCSKGNNELEVYSFSGENDRVKIVNGVIVFSEHENIFNGGSLELLQADYSNIASCSMNFYVMSGNEKIIVLSKSIEDFTEGNADITNSLGQISSEDLFANITKEHNDSWRNNLYFEISAKDAGENDIVDIIRLKVTEITNDN